MSNKYLLWKFFFCILLWNRKPQQLFFYFYKNVIFIFISLKFCSSWIDHFLLVEIPAHQYDGTETVLDYIEATGTINVCIIRHGWYYLLNIW